MKYFAYGSNMDPEEMARVCPEGQFVTIGRLAGHRFDFTRHSERRDGGVADIVEEADSEVWGVVYDVSETELEALDRKEGVAVGAYKRKQVEILTLDDETVLVLTYSVVHKEGPFAPTSKYMGLIISGARHWSLPEQYVDSLARNLGRLVTGATIASPTTDLPSSPSTNTGQLGRQ